MHLFYIIAFLIQSVPKYGMSESTSEAVNPWHRFNPARDTKYPERDRPHHFEWLCCIIVENGDRIPANQEREMVESSGPGKTFKVEFGPLKKERSGCDCHRDIEHVHVIVTFSGDVSRKSAFEESGNAFLSLGLDPEPRDGFSSLASVYKREFLEATDMFI